jgi:hypothetical protein
LELMADYALSVKLFSRMPSCVSSSTASAVEKRLQKLRSTVRTVPGLYRTNAQPIEAVSTRFWLAFDRWMDIDAQGFAVEEANQTGDWHMFKRGDGNGDYAVQEENGGFLLSTTAFVFQAGELVRVFSFPQGFKPFIVFANTHFLSFALSLS